MCIIEAASLLVVIYNLRCLVKLLIRKGEEEILFCFYVFTHQLIRLFTVHLLIIGHLSPATLVRLQRLACARVLLLALRRSWVYD